MNRIHAIMLVALAFIMVPSVAPAQPHDGRWERSDKTWKYDRADWRDRDDGDWAERDRYAPRRRHAHVRIPPGHLPPPGECRLWYVDRPPGHQPPPVPCTRLRRVRNFDRVVIVSHYGVEHAGYDTYDKRYRRHRPRDGYGYRRPAVGVEVILDVGGDRGHAHVEYRQRRR